MKTEKTMSKDLGARSFLGRWVPGSAVRAQGREDSQRRVW